MLIGALDCLLYWGSQVVNHVDLSFGIHFFAKFIYFNNVHEN